MRTLHVILLLLCWNLFAIESPLTVDTYQPRAVLPQLTSDQGGCIDLRVTVLENHARWRDLRTNDVFVFQWTTNRVSGLWCISTSVTNDIARGTTLIPISPIGVSGALQYEIYLLRSEKRYPLGAGRLIVEATSGYGEITESSLRQPLNTDVIMQTGSNQFARMSDLSDTVKISAPSQSVISVNGKTGIVVLAASDIGALTNEQDLAALSALYSTNAVIIDKIANEAALRLAGDAANSNHVTVSIAPLSSSVDATNAMFSAWFAGLQSRTSYWDTAYSWGDWHAAVANNSAAIAVLQTNTVPPLPYTIITNAPWLSDFSTMTPADIITAGGVTNAGRDHVTLSNLTWSASGHSGTPACLAGFFEGGMAGYSYLGAGLYFGGSDELSVSNDIITGAALGITALQSEADLAALRLYHYGSPDIIESPAEWFSFDGAGTITGYYANQNVVVPWEIGGVTVSGLGGSAFDTADLISIKIPRSVTNVDNAAFANNPGLTAVYFSGNAPNDIGNAYYSSLNATNYVTNPTATGWGVTWNGRTVVRPPLHADAITLGGVTHTNWPSADVSGLATTQSVDAVAGDLASATIMMNNHTSNGTIGSDGHASSAEKANWNGKLSASGGTASNLTVRGWIAMPQSAPTNLVLRLVCSNEHIYVEEVYQ